MPLHAATISPVSERNGYSAPRRRGLLIGTSRQARLLDMDHDRRFDTMVDLRLQKVRLEQIRVKSAQKEADRDLERMRLEQRERIREEKARIQRIAAEDDEFLSQMQGSLDRARERIREQGKREAVRIEAIKKKSAEEAVLAEKVARVMRGEWSPGDD